MKISNFTVLSIMRIRELVSHANCTVYIHFFFQMLYLSPTTECLTWAACRFRVPVEFIAQLARGIGRLLPSGWRAHLQNHINNLRHIINMFASLCTWGDKPLMSPFLHNAVFEHSIWNSSSTLCPHMLNKLLLSHLKSEKSQGFLSNHISLGQLWCRDIRESFMECVSMQLQFNSM